MKPNDLLYHYTTLESFLSILNNGELWASHIRYLNDTSEQRLAWKHARARIKNRLEMAGVDIRDRLLKFQKLANSPINFDLFVLCFSKDGGDTLSQWRGYGGSTGVSIGFEPDELKSRCSSFIKTIKNDQLLHSGWAFLNPVRYIEPDGDDQSNQVIDTIIDNPNPHEVESRFSVDEVFCRRICISSANSKHIAFSEEKEWRIAIFDVPENLIHFSPRKSMIVPYVPFDLGKGTAEWPLIQRVVVGPSPHQAETIDAIKMRVDNRVIVEGSSIPFRSW